ncbi:MAG: 4-hydroxy-tetrahydrodipicolinate reductase [Spirochaetales bacterium]|nr:4-hydroxy-tetrahydrodipicolinate reductase [Spirochaetales bacterium]
MGHQVEEAALARGHEISCRVDAGGNGDATTLTAALLEDADGVIEFALPTGLKERAKLYAQCGVPAAVGTTGWDHLIPEISALFQEGSGAFMRGSNFSVGAHLFFRLTRAAARLANRVEEYDASLIEHHHTKKADFPSGTALTAAEGMLEELDRKTHICATLPQGPIAPEALQVAAVRVGSVPGVHEMLIDSPNDYLSLRHEARNRGGFALGSVRALEWLEGRQGWYEAEAFIDDLLTGEEQ